MTEEAIVRDQMEEIDRLDGGDCDCGGSVGDQRGDNGCRRL